MSLLVLCFSSELGKFPLKGYWKWEVLYTILFPLFIAALCFMILQVYLAYFDDGSESVEVNVVEVDVVEVDVSELGATEVVNVSEVNFHNVLIQGSVVVIMQFLIFINQTFLMVSMALVTMVD